MPDSTATIACPVCGTAVTGPPLRRWTAEQAAAHFCPRSRDAGRHARLQRTVTRLWGGDEGLVFVCPECGFGFAWPHVGGDEEYYGILHEQAGYPANRWEYDWTIANVLSRFPTGGTILDIGAGSGVFLRRLAPGWRRLATEGSPATREILDRAGIGCFTDIAAALAAARGSCAVVTMFQVLEHIAGFRSLLAECHALLQPGGMIVISVPLAPDLFVQEDLTGCPDMTPNHVNKWSPESLSRALRVAGFAPQPAVVARRRLKNLTSRVELITRSQAARNPASLAARAYAIGNRRLRLGALAAVSALNLVGTVPHWPRLLAGKDFVMVGRKD
jgi:SAM-dependent methyltransferase